LVTLPHFLCFARKKSAFLKPFFPFM